ncbi:hypothetical protein CPAR01_02541 [Colletotrichum paranaense]|uniref:Uncharacterized protein n=1 Tax=Colletotrichum paranaense TaxID=1914294 RepID=A0ABQ9SZX2_9PEZI|nr:uncharacterized protein CPAR01_02541 [Colletotrichum paranaense]KAK1545039.1 hypothetical protein CPAR01_02541 [Colletotrichum paranaense]
MAGRNAIEWAEAGVSESTGLRISESVRDMWSWASNGEEQELPGTEGAEVTDSGPPSRLAPGAQNSRVLESTIRAETTDRMHAAAYEWLEASSEVIRFIIIVQGLQVKIILIKSKAQQDRCHRKAAQ